MAKVTNTVKGKLHPITGEDLRPTTVTVWRDGTTPMSDALCGGLYNKDADADSATYNQYFKWNSSGDYPTSRLTTANVSNFTKLLNDFGTAPVTLIIDRLIVLADNYEIPANFELRILPSCGFNIPSGKMLTCKGRVNAGLYQIFFGTGLTNLQETEQPVEWYGAKADYTGIGFTTTYTYGTPGVGGVIGTDSGPAIQRAIYSSKGYVRMCKGNYWTASSIRVVAKAKLVGAGSTGGTELVASRQFDGPVLDCRDYDNDFMYWHAGEVRNISVRNGKFDGVYVYQPGETTDVDGIMVSDCGRHNIVLKDGIPARLGSVSVYRGGVSGVYFEDCQFNVDVTMISGDDNDVLVYIKGGGPQTTYNIKTIKSERGNQLNHTTGQYGHNNVILVENSVNSTIIVGGLHYINHVSAAGKNLIEYKRTSGVGEYVNLEINQVYGNVNGLADYDYGYNNTVLGPRIPMAEFKDKHVTHGILSIAKANKLTILDHDSDTPDAVIFEGGVFSGDYKEILFKIYANGKMELIRGTAGVASAGFEIRRDNVLDLLSGDSLGIALGTWDSGHIILGGMHIWVDGNNKPRYKFSQPTSSSDGSNFTTSGDLPKFLVDSGTTAPTDAQLNTTYGTNRAGTFVVYPNLTAGAIMYYKETDSGTSEWYPVSLSGAFSSVNTPSISYAGGMLINPSTTASSLVIRIGSTGGTYATVWQGNTGNLVVQALAGSFPTENNYRATIDGAGTGAGNGAFLVKNGTSRLEGLLSLPNRPVYADNAAALAGGLTVGNVYRTSTGQLMIVY